MRESETPGRGADVNLWVEQEESASDADRMAPKLVLAVDEGNLERKLAAAFVEQAGCVCVAAGGLEEALQMLHVALFDAVLLRLEPPGAAGILAAAALRRLPNRNAAVRIVALAPDPETAAQAERSGQFQRVLRAPFQLDELSGALAGM